MCFYGVILLSLLKSPWFQIKCRSDEQTKTPHWGWNCGIDGGGGGGSSGGSDGVQWGGGGKAAEAVVYSIYAAFIMCIIYCAQ